MTRWNLVALISLPALGLLALGTLALPSRLDVRREAIVHASPSTIRPLLADYRARERWIYWTVSDPEASYRYGGDAEALGSTMRWEGDQVGTATLTLERADDRAVVSRMEYEDPLRMVTHDRFTLEPLDDGTTRVTWSNEGDLPFGPARLFAVFADSIIGPDYARGLERLDALVQTQAQARARAQLQPAAR
jgi:hypothetical protein